MAAGNFADAYRALFAEIEKLQDLAPELHAFDLYRSDMALPAIWLWMRTPPDAPQKADNCHVESTARLLVCVTENPHARPDDDRRHLVDYVQLVLETLDPVLYGFAPLGAQTRAGWGAGAQFASIQMGDAQIACAELPVDVVLTRSFVPVGP